MTKIITIGLSDQHFTSKPQGKQVGSLAFTVTSLSVRELLSKLTQGYCIAHVFGHCNTFTMKEKNNANFTSASFISVDVDNSDVDMYTYIHTLIHKPSIAYTTFSNQMEGKGYRFRLIYVLSKDVTTVERYKDCYDYFTNGLNLKDNCMQSAAQFIIGTSSSAETYVSDEVYNLEDIPALRKPNLIIKEMRNSNSISKDEVKIDESFKNDFYTMKYSDFLVKYKEVYPFFTSTPLPSVSEDVPYILLPSNYLEIKRYWCTDSVINDKGEVVRTYYNRVRRLKDGQGRRKKLYINAILRRMMVENITVEYLITMLANELFYYVNNSTDKITKQDIVTIASNAFRADLNHFNNLRVQKHPTFVVNPSYCFKYGCNKKSASNIAKKMILWEQIGSLYDCSLTDKENLKVLNENGIKVSKRTIARFKDEQGITIMRKPNLIIKEENNAQTDFYNNREQEHYTVRIAQIEKDEENNVPTKTYNNREQVHYKVRLAYSNEDNEKCHSNSIIKEGQVHYKVRLAHSDDKKEETEEKDTMFHSNLDNTEMFHSNSITNREQVHYRVTVKQTEETEEKDTMFHSNSIIKDGSNEMSNSNSIIIKEQVHYKVRTLQSDDKKDAKMTEEEREMKRAKAKANIEELLRRYESIMDSDAIIHKYPIVMEYIRGKREYLTQAESSIYLLKANQIAKFRIRR